LVGTWPETNTKSPARVAGESGRAKRSDAMGDAPNISTFMGGLLVGKKVLPKQLCTGKPCFKSVQACFMMNCVKNLHKSFTF
jgi:hypothetical protein